MIKRSDFPQDFLWGAATASAQVEGGWDADGRTPSIWDIAPAGKIKNNDTPHIGCDHFHLWKEDVALMKEMGLNAYRLSVSWSRVQPAEGQVCEAGLQFYKNLVSELLANGIEPLVTLYHWDLPVWVQEQGGWANEKIVPLFAEYTRIVVDALSDKAKWWFTINEPSNFIHNGYVTGAHAPFIKNEDLFVPASCNCLKAHKAAARIIREYATLPPKIGVAMSVGAFVAKQEDDATIEEARRGTFDSFAGDLYNRWWCDALVLGKGVAIAGKHRIPDDVLQETKGDLDFLGINIYAPFTNGPAETDLLPPDRKTDLGWVIDGRCAYWNIRFFYDRYQLPIMISENGAAFNDTVSEDGCIHDERRVSYLQEYLSGLKRAVSEGYPVPGYLCWSLMDNFEWCEGYGARFGLVYTDYETKKRIWKDSAYYYRDVVTSSGKRI